MDPIVITLDGTGSVEYVALGFLMDGGVVYVVCSTTDGRLFVEDIRRVKIARPHTKWPLGYWDRAPEAVQ